jgi:hypothetical protein
VGDRATSDEEDRAMDEEIREEQLDGEPDEQDVDAHALIKWGTSEDDEEQERNVLHK